MSNISAIISWCGLPNGTGQTAVSASIPKRERQSAAPVSLRMAACQMYHPAGTPVIFFRVCLFFPAFDISVKIPEIFPAVSSRPQEYLAFDEPAVFIAGSFPSLHLSADLPSRTSGYSYTAAVLRKTESESVRSAPPISGR